MNAGGTVIAHNRIRQRLIRKAVLAALVLMLGSCGWFRPEPIVTNRALSITNATETSFVVNWQAAGNDPRLFGRFIYDIYIAEEVVDSVGDLRQTDPKATGFEEDFGDGSLAYRVEDLQSAAGYYVTVAVSPRDYSSTELYRGTVGMTRGGLDASASIAGPASYAPLDLDASQFMSTYDIAIDVTGGPVDLYLLFTRPSSSPAKETIAPVVTSSGSTAATASATNRSLSHVDRQRTDRGPIVLRDRPIIEETRDQLKPGGMTSRSLSQPTSSTSDAVGTTRTFRDYDGSLVTIPATARAVVTDGSQDPPTSLTIWVADDSWIDTGNKANLVDGTMVTALADAFLIEGSSDDIYGWLTTIFGDEWGAHSYGNLIPNDNHIDILLYDIENDNSTNGGVVGYFWPKDNYYRDSGSPILNASNERVMFYLDSVMYATADGLNWRISDYWPSEMIATLAHEFQHMINFYQRDVLRGTSTPTWLNEMLSMTAEDLVADKIGVRGPRGVDPPTDYSAGNSNVWFGRMPDYNAFPHGSLTNWGSTGEVLESYGLSYSFGAFLSRNYGGAVLARNLVQNPQEASDDILSTAIAASGGPAGLELRDLLWKWGVSMLLSDNTATAPPVQINSGTAFNSTVGGTEYKLGSLNAFNYQQGGFGSPDGPVIWNEATGIPGALEPVSALFYRYATDVSATTNVTVALPKEVQLTVVAK